MQILRTRPYFKTRLKSVVIELIVILLVCLWVYTGINKIIDYHNTKLQLHRSPFIQDYANFLAIAVPVGELLLTGLLIFNKTRQTGLYLSFGLMFLFTGYVWLMLNFAYDLPCSCGGIISKLSWDDHLKLNIVITLITVLGIFLNARDKNPKTT